MEGKSLASCETLRKPEMTHPACLGLVCIDWLAGWPGPEVALWFHGVLEACSALV